jgi:hypothetical protein
MKHTVAMILKNGFPYNIQFSIENLFILLLSWNKTKIFLYLCLQLTCKYGQLC